MRQAGFTLVELLIVLAVIGVVAGLGVNGLNNFLVSSEVDRAGQVVAQQFALAKNSVRRFNQDATVTLNPTDKTVVVKRGTTVLATESMKSTTMTVTCRDVACPSGNEFTLRAPFGTLAQDIKVVVQRGSQSRSAYILGPVMLVVRR